MKTLLKCPQNGLHRKNFAPGHHGGGRAYSAPPQSSQLLFTPSMPPCPMAMGILPASNCRHKILCLQAPINFVDHCCDVPEMYLQRSPPTATGSPTGFGHFEFILYFTSFYNYNLCHVTNGHTYDDVDTYPKIQNTLIINIHNTLQIHTHTECTQKINIFGEFSGEHGLRHKQNSG